MDMEGCDGHGPDDPVFVMVLFNDGRHRPGHPNAVQPMTMGFCSPFSSGDNSAQGFAVLGAQLEDLAHFDPPGPKQGSAALGTWVASFDEANIGH